MAINPEKNIQLILNSMQQIKLVLDRIQTSTQLDTSQLVRAIERVAATYGDAEAAYQEMISGGMSNAQIATSFADSVYPPPTPGATFANINSAKNAFLTSYANNVWPLFEGKVWDLTAGNHVPFDVVKPAAFDTANTNFLNAIGALINIG